MGEKILSVDIGGTSVKLAIISGDKIEKKTVLLGGKHPLDVLTEFMDSVMVNQVEFAAIAVASAGRIDARNGIVLYASPNIPNWTGVPVAKILRSRYGVPCFVLNDAQAAALAEARSRNVSNLVLLTIGTGLGGGIVLNNQLIFGNSWEAGEIGHSILKPNGRRCNCGKKGCAEMYISMRVLHKYSHEKDRKKLIERFKEKDPHVVSSVERVCKDLAIVIDKIFLTIDPQLVVVGGGFCELGPGALEILRDHLKMYSQRSLYDVSQVDFSILGNDAGIIGAAMYAKERLLGGS